MNIRQNVQPICAVYGKNLYLRRRAVADVIKRELCGGDQGLNLVRVDGAKTDNAAAVLDEVRTYSMLGDRRVVVVDEADAFISKSRKSLERYAEKPSESGCLILVCASFPGNTRLAKIVKKIGEAIECKPLFGKAVVSWLSSVARSEYGKSMSFQAANRLYEHVGGAQDALDAELSKLAMYVGNRSEITPHDVDDVIGNYREQSVFAVMDAIAVGDADTALTEWQQVLATDRAAPGRAIGGLAWSVRQLLGARRQLDAGAALPGLARAARTDVDVFARRMKRTSTTKLENQLVDLLAADLEFKTGLGNVGSAVEKFIVKHSVAAKS